MSNVYFDTSVWIRYFIGDRQGQLNSAAQTQISRINTGDIGIVSILVLLEVIDVIRKRIVERQLFEGTDASKIQKIKLELKQKVDMFVDMITRLAKANKIKIVDPKIQLAPHLRATLDTTMALDYKIFTYSKCGFCHQTIPDVYSYKGLGHYDIQHALIAKYSDCEEIVSCDKAFSNLESVPDFSNISFTII